MYGYDYDDAVEFTSKAIITWADDEREYKLKVENEDRHPDFEKWVEEYAEDLADEEARKKNTKFVEILDIKYEEDWIEGWEVAYEMWVNWAEFQWECEMGK